VLSSVHRTQTARPNRSRPLRILSQVRETLGVRVAAAVPGVEVLTIPEDGDLPADAEGEVLLTLAWGTANLGRVLARGVRWVHALGTGMDGFPFHLVGADTIVTCSRGASAIPIAEWVLAVMLAFEKRLPDAWLHAPPAQRWGDLRLGALYGRTLGLVGLGGIGTAVAVRALAFDMRVRACRRSAAPAPVPGVEIVTSLEELVGTADHVVLAAPATRATRGLFGPEVFAAMKPGAHLVNVARGALLREDALRAALDAGRVAMASLDAVEPEPLPAGHWMYTHPRVRLSPHLSWRMPGAADVLLERFIDNLRRWQAGAALTGVVDREAGY
jgi:phosphoglycerate dehydrogenase-like enzyme